jgi:hypothetical protein
MILLEKNNFFERLADLHARVDEEKIYSNLQLKVVLIH